MSTQNVIRTLVEYHVASNRRLWNHLLENLTDEPFTQALGFSHGSVRNQVVHLAATDRYWLHDIQSKPVTGLDPQGFPTRERFTALWESIEGALLAYVQSLTDAGLEEVPDGLMEVRWQALVHVVNHGTDHRAQILSMLHGLGAPTFEQDFPDHLRASRWVSKADVLKLIRYWHGKIEQALESVPHERMAEPAMGEWTVKDILAKLSWHDREMAAALKARELSGPALWKLPKEERNRRIAEQFRSQTLEESLREHDESHRSLVEE
ncbi:MAG TPA: DinB family protein, partial [Anaerolineales bacterium]|nr:DinB family protein [Anaerolineales bacterium]